MEKQVVLLYVHFGYHLSALQKSLASRAGEENRSQLPIPYQMNHNIHPNYEEKMYPLGNPSIRR